MYDGRAQDNAFIHQSVLGVVACVDLSSTSQQWRDALPRNISYIRRSSFLTTLPAALQSSASRLVNVGDGSFSVAGPRL